MYAFARLAQLMVGFLNTGGAPQPSDVLFVFAGRPERKSFGIELWKRHLAPELILSVGRFEWRGFYGLGFPSDGGLRTLVDSTRPQDRHFFVRVNASETSASLVRLGNLGTQSEARTLAKLLRGTGYQSVTIVSTSFHLRRARLVLRRALRGSGIQVYCIGVREDPTDITRAVFKEFAKYLLYLIGAWGKGFKSA